MMYILYFHVYKDTKKLSMIYILHIKKKYVIIYLYLHKNINLETGITIITHLIICLILCDCNLS